MLFLFLSRCRGNSHASDIKFTLLLLHIRICFFFFIVLLGKSTDRRRKKLWKGKMKAKKRKKKQEEMIDSLKGEV